MKKKLVGIIAIIVVVLAGAAFYFTKQAQDKSSQVAESTTSQKSTSVMKKKSSASSSSKIEKKNQTEDGFSTDEWMLMGYMAYARKNHDNEATPELVNETAEELSDGDLKAVKNSDGTYTLSNQYGSVDVTVEGNQVKVTNDGTTINSKSDLKKTFSSYQSKLSQMAQNIGKSDDKKSTDSNVDFDTKELAVLAYVESNKGSATDNIKQAEQAVNRGYQPSEDADYVSGLYKNKANYSIAFNHSTSQYNEYQIEGDSLQTIVSGGGVQSDGSKYSIKELSKKYAPYKNEIDEILNRLEYNKKNLSKVDNQINKQAEESLEDNDDD